MVLRNLSSFDHIDSGFLQFCLKDKPLPAIQSVPLKKKEWNNKRVKEKWNNKRVKEKLNNKRIILLSMASSSNGKAGDCGSKGSWFKPR